MAKHKYSKTVEVFSERSNKYEEQMIVEAKTDNSHKILKFISFAFLKHLELTKYAKNPSENKMLKID